MMNEFDETENGQISQIARPSTIDLPKMAKITIGTFLCTPQNTIKTTTTTFFGVVRYSSASSNSLKRSNHLLLPIWSQQLSLHRRTIISIQPINHKKSIPWNLWSTPPYQSLWIIIIWDQAMEFNTLSDCYMHEVVSSSALPMVAKTKRNVTFNPTCTVRTPTCRSITDEEKLASYYNKNELRSMKREAVNGLLQLHATVSEQRPDSIDSAITTDTLRGMELVLQPQRRKNRELVRQSVLKYQMLLDSKSNLTDEQRHLRLAHITAKLNRWSSHVAFQTAWRDACEAVDFSPETMMDYHCSPFTTDVPMMSSAVGSLSSTTSQCEMQFAWTNVESFPIYCMEH